MKFARRLVEMLRHGGAGHTAGELLTQAARLRRHDPTINRRWRRRMRFAPAGLPAGVSASAPQAQKDCPVVVTDAAHLAPLLDHMATLLTDFRLVVFGVSGASRAEDQRVIQVGPGEQAAVQELISLVKAQVVTLVTSGFLPARDWFRAMPAALAGNATAAYADYEQADGRSCFLPDFSPALLDYPGYLPALAVSAELFVHWLEANPNWQVGQAIRTLAKSGKTVTHLYKPLGRLSVVPAPTNPRAPAEAPVDGASIIIPTRDNVALLSQCVASLRRSLPAQAFELILIDNNSVEPGTRQYLADQANLPNTRVIEAPVEFNWSLLNNLGANTAQGKTLVFLNNDVEVVSPDWLARLALLAAGEGIGAVGPLLLYDDRVVQHAGIVVGYGGFADHVYAGATIDEAADSCFLPADVTRNVAAVTGACLVTAKTTFDALGGFDERLTVAGDLDYCLRALAGGYLNIFDGTTRLIHHESRTRAHGLPRGEKTHLRQLIGQVLPNGDPYYHPGLSLHSKFPLPDIF
ncbi:MAG: glycosyltransferase [Pseudomonadota bacterium]